MSSRFLILLTAAGLLGCNEPPLGAEFTGTNNGGGAAQSGTTITLSGPASTVPINSAAVIVANVTQNGAPAANGTTVQFTTTGGLFTNGNLNNTTFATIGGVATVSLSSQSAVSATVTARVNNVTATFPVTFVAPNP